MNRTARLHDGQSANREECAEWALDAIIENFQLRYKKMSFNNTADDWVKHSINMPFVSRCKTFIEDEMSIRYDVEAMDAYNEDGKDGGIDTGSTDKGNKKKKTIEPKFVQELELISEILSSAKMFVETNGRVLSHKLLWDVLPFLKSVPKNDTLISFLSLSFFCVSFFGTLFRNSNTSHNNL